VDYGKKKLRESMIEEEKLSVEDNPEEEKQDQKEEVLPGLTKDQFLKFSF